MEADQENRSPTSFMDSSSSCGSSQQHVRCTCRSFGEKCTHLAKKQRAKFYILRRCIAILVCWHERTDP
ncbi:hypothetical protein Vadar_032534 [Vaccinium darrowii]|uniref:Uncharacterized protein n=1 Tax=Vaccinium darrowii TaxID=229202 RepID=A0ACB7YRG7_9ERIC|nr:hypothetical protein Vadar_032534 [Vaccinium darrowii]